jgi:hypothetical protein
MQASREAPFPAAHATFGALRAMNHGEKIRRACVETIPRRETMRQAADKQKFSIFNAEFLIALSGPVEFKT